MWTSEFWLPLKTGPADPPQRSPLVSINPSFGVCAAIIGSTLPREAGREMSHCLQNLKTGTEVSHHWRNKKRRMGQRQSAPGANLLLRIKDGLIHCAISQMGALAILTKVGRQPSKGLPRGKLDSWIVLNLLRNPVLRIQQAGEAQRPCTFLESSRLSNN